jgi:hypothetical protein
MPVHVISVCAAAQSTSRSTCARKVQASCVIHSPSNVLPCSVQPCCCSDHNRQVQELVAVGCMSWHYRVDLLLCRRAQGACDLNFLANEPTSMMVNMVISVHTGSNVFPGPIVLLSCRALVVCLSSS